MRLKKIEVLGFKSFADRQVVLVDDHITGVIGPNGCGKSNIVDAIRWCMGEQSAKHLRGSGMADVIFAGCSSRGPAGLAEVTLTFASTADAPPPYSEMSEVAITRRLFADGTSEYLINKVPARLRDIGDLLAGTGVGTKGYSIIEQGQVGKIVGSKPEDRRNIIDEAAGITRFKAQKAAATRRIEGTRQNLLRVRDVITELDDRLGTLRRQAQKAERYKKYRQELRDVELWVSAQRLLELHATRGVLEARRGSLGQEIDDARASISAREAQIAAGRIQASEIEADLVARQQVVFDLDNQIRLREAEDDYHRREREGQLATAAQARGETEVAERSLQQVQAELAVIEAEVAAMIDGGDGNRGDALARLQMAHAQVEAQLASERSQRDAAARELAERTSAQAGARARAAALHEQAGDLAARIEQASAGIALARDEHASAEGSHAALQGRAEALAEELAALARRRSELDHGRAELRERLAAAEVELDTRRAEVHRARSRLQSLEEIQARYRSCGSGVQVVMEHRAELELHAGEPVASAPPKAVIGVVADYITAPAHLEAAVSAVLGDRLEGIVVEGTADAARGVELLKRAQEGRISFVPRQGRPRARGEGVRAPLRWRDPAQSGTGSIEVVDMTAGDDPALLDVPAASGRFVPEEGVLGRLVDLVQCSADLGELADVLLGDAVVVEGLQRALELWQARRYDATLVTLDGDRVEPTGVVVGGSPTALNAALLQQKREIRELQQIVEQLVAEFEATRARHLALAQAAAELDAERERTEQDALQRHTAKAACEAEIAAAQATAARAGKALAEGEQRLALLQAEQRARADEAARLAASITDVDSRIVELEAAIAGGDGRERELEVERAHLAESLTEAKVELAKWQQRSDALAGTIDRLQRQRAGDESRLVRLRETAEKAASRAEELAAALESSRIERDSLIERSREATAAVHDIRERHDAMRVELDEIEASVKVLRGDLEGQRERLQEVDLGLKENQLERGHLELDVRERLDVELREVLIDFHDRPLCGPAEKERAAELKRVIARMGEVNLTAIDEFEEVSKRYEYLVSQRDDLENAVAQLQEAIDRIDKTTRQMFRDTFNAVNERFQQIFPRLFAGGRAHLELTNPEDMLDTGIEISAQPPGKQLRSLDLLSGGEKALTAVSLIFAIFLIKPSPFCLLDEVDAPLDEVNVGRFCALVRELSATTQFVIITHNKVTMEIADRLYGVTMEQRGVSKLVSVNIRRAVEMVVN